MAYIREQSEVYGTMSNYVMALVKRDNEENLHADVRQLLYKIEDLIQDRIK
jgi:hypothetical protein